MYRDYPGHRVPLPHPCACFINDWQLRDPLNKRGPLEPLDYSDLGAKEVDYQTKLQYATKLQSAWRRRLAYMYAKDLKQQKLCRDRREEIKAGISVDCDACSSSGKKSANTRARFLKKAWRQTDDLLFKGISRVKAVDRGDNWNERWQEALALPTKTDMDKKYRKQSLEAVYSDFVHTAVTYGRTIISEYFLHEYLKSVRPKQLGGVAGGKKYLWRGILFKLADGSKGPYGGSDEAAAKAAGHELRGGSEYLRAGGGLCVPPMCLLDYKGFRMLAQAHVPLGPNSLKMGTPDGGRTVLNSSSHLENASRLAAEKLGLRSHTVGGRLVWEAHRDEKTDQMKKRKRNVGGQVLHTAADVEGHEGFDSRMYLLDLARAFPPEDPNATPHLNGMLSISAKVIVRKDGQQDALATVTKAHPTLVDYDILFPSGDMEEGIPAHLLRDLRLFIFYRLLRPEFVRDRGSKILNKVHLPNGYKFPTVVITNPMMFAIKYGRNPASEEKSKEKGNKASEAGRLDESGSSSARFSSGSKARSSEVGLGRTKFGPLTPVQEGPKTLAPLRERGLADTSATPQLRYSPQVDVGAEKDDETRGDLDISLTSIVDSTSHYAKGFGQSDRSLGETYAFGSEDRAVGDGDEELRREDQDGSEEQEEWRRKALECGIEFVESGDTYYEGFKRSELEDDEAELQRRGGVGYRPFVPSENWPGANDPVVEEDVSTSGRARYTAGREDVHDVNAQTQDADIEPASLDRLSGDFGLSSSGANTRPISPPPSRDQTAGLSSADLAALSLEGNATVEQASGAGARDELHDRLSRVPSPDGSVGSFERDGMMRDSQSYAPFTRLPSPAQVSAGDAFHDDCQHDEGIDDEEASEVDPVDASGQDGAGYEPGRGADRAPRALPLPQRKIYRGGVTDHPPPVISLVIEGHLEETEEEGEGPRTGRAGRVPDAERRRLQENARTGGNGDGAGMEEFDGEEDAEDMEGRFVHRMSPYPCYNGFETESLSSMSATPSARSTWRMGSQTSFTHFANDASGHVRLRHFATTTSSRIDSRSRDILSGRYSPVPGGLNARGASFRSESAILGNDHLSTSRALQAFDEPDPDTANDDEPDWISRPPPLSEDSKYDPYNKSWMASKGSGGSIDTARRNWQRDSEREIGTIAGFRINKDASERLINGHTDSEEVYQLERRDGRVDSGAGRLAPGGEPRRPILVPPSPAGIGNDRSISGEVSRKPEPKREPERWKAEEKDAARPIPVMSSVAPHADGQVGVCSRGEEGGGGGSGGGGGGGYDTFTPLAPGLLLDEVAHKLDDEGVFGQESQSAAARITSAGAGVANGVSGRGSGECFESHSMAEPPASSSSQWEPRYGRAPPKSLSPHPGQAALPPRSSTSSVAPRAAGPAKAVEGTSSKTIPSERSLPSRPAEPKAEEARASATVSAVAAIATTATSMTATTSATASATASATTSAKTSATASATTSAMARESKQDVGVNGGGNSEETGGKPVPLSPDALTAFSNGDPEARQRNKEITEATQFLLTIVVPATAKYLCSKSPDRVANLDLATELHKYGINMRHIGLLRAYVTPTSHQLKPQHNWTKSSSSVFASAPSAVPATSSSRNDASNRGEWREDMWCGKAGMERHAPSLVKVASGSSDASAQTSPAGVGIARGASNGNGGNAKFWEGGNYTSEAILRDRVLVELVVRTLKLVLREFQRLWMKSEQSTSEQGMHMLVAEFLNMVTGTHARTEIFWRENVTVGVCQRFGTVALTDSERSGLWKACSERPMLLFMIVEKLVKVTGVRFKESVYQQLRREKVKVVGMNFAASDIKDIDPVVTPMTIYSHSH